MMKDMLGGPFLSEFRHWRRREGWTPTFKTSSFLSFNHDERCMSATSRWRYQLRRCDRLLHRHTARCVSSSSGWVLHFRPGRKHHDLGKWSGVFWASYFEVGVCPRSVPPGVE
uniref:Uncharacterized protein n=1 Tax=Physcomitrium patens TaxID=3218 RepID=A0A7I4ANW6_PHYPA